MKGISSLVIAISLAGCAAQPLKQNEISNIDSGELCIAAAQTYITGQPVNVGGRPLARDTILGVLSTRSERCEPQDHYLKIGYERAQLQVQQQAQAAQQQQAISVALLGVSQQLQAQQMIQQQQTTNAILQQQATQQAAPVTTRCSKDMYGNVTCRSW